MPNVPLRMILNQHALISRTSVINFQRRNHPCNGLASRGCAQVGQRAPDYFVRSLWMNIIFIYVRMWTMCNRALFADPESVMDRLHTHIIVFITTINWYDQYFIRHSRALSLFRDHWSSNSAAQHINNQWQSIQKISLK